MGKYEYLYDKNRNLTKQTVSSDSGGVGGYVNEYEYAPSEQVLEWSHKPGSATARVTAYTWDKNSNRTSVSLDGATPTETTYNWDNSIKALKVPGEADQLHTYNGAGLLTRDGCSEYSYDAFDRVEEKRVVVDTSACGSDDRTTVYTYDGLDRQRTVTVSGAAKPSADRITRSVFDGLSAAVVGQTGAVNGNNDGPVVLYQLDPGGAAVAYKQTGTTGAGTAFLDEDGHGNITAVTASSGSSLVCGARFGAFGDPVDPAPSGAPGTGAPGDGNGVCRTDSAAARATGNTYWYRGQVRDGSTGNYQLGTRTYDPTKAAFTTPDSYRVSSSATDLSVGVDPLTSNTYTYVNGNPINMIDSDGHKPICNGDECKFDVTPKGHFKNVRAGAPPPAAYVSGEELAKELAPSIEKQVYETLPKSWGSDLTQQFVEDYVSALRSEDYEGLSEFDRILAEEACVKEGGGKECYGLSTCTWRCIPGNLKKLAETLDPTSPYRGCFLDGNKSDCVAAGVSVVLAGTGGILAKLFRGSRAAKTGTEIRKVGDVLETVDDVMANPQLLKGRHPALVENILKDTPGWQVETLGRGSAQGRGWVFRQYTDAGNPTGLQLRWHPGGGHHGPEPYWRVIGPNGDLGGIIR